MILDKMKSMIHTFENPVQVDPEKFQDPLALSLPWQGMGRNSPGATSTVLYEAAPGVLKYKPSTAARIFALIFMLAGILSSVVYFFVPVTGSGPKWVLLLVGLLFTAAGILIFLRSSMTIAFDGPRGLFYKGRSAKEESQEGEGKSSLKFSDIHALQLLLRMARVQSSDNRPDRFVPVYELNLVKNDGGRMHVITYTRKEKAREDAWTISDLLHVPVWDGIDG